MGEFRFKQFAVSDDRSGMKISTDGVLLGAWATIPEGCRRVADLGAGSGLIALMLAQRLVPARPDAEIFAVELDDGACADCRDNAARSPWAASVETLQGDASAVCAGREFDLIVSNPPYFATGERSASAARASARHEASLSARTVVDIASHTLSPGGEAAIIAPADTEADLIFHAELSGLKLRRLTRVASRAGRPPLRCLYRFARADGPCSVETLDIRDASGNFSEEYARLTRPFYLNI